MSSQVSSESNGRPRGARPRPRNFVGAFVALIVLLVITASAALVDLGPWNTVIAFSVAVAKALLIVLFFMELRFSDSRVVWFAAGTGFLWLGILLVLSGSDYLSRGYLHIAGK